MSHKDFGAEVDEEVRQILASSFTIQITETKSVPHSGDGAITFPNLDDQWQGCKLIETCVLYVDIRRSTDLNLTHKAVTMAKLYSTFVRAMTNCALRHGGHVRGIIGDRVMVIFDAENCFVSAVETALSMNSIVKYVLNKRFPQSEIACGIGIDYGKMLATKTGFRRHGHEQQNYRSLVWLGRPANIASKLTDAANKPSEYANYQLAYVGYDYGTGDWHWQHEDAHLLIDQFERDYDTKQWRHKNPACVSFFRTSKQITMRERTPPILMTKAVFDGYKRGSPTSNIVKERLLYPVTVSIPGNQAQIFGGDVIWKEIKGE